jgi:hypothetical protein
LLAGVVRTLAGAATTGWVDGVGAAAKFLGPKGVSVDSNGVVFVADYGNYRVRKVTSAGSVWAVQGLNIIMLHYASLCSFNL